MDTQRRPLLVANWKMHFTLREARAEAQRFRAAVEGLEHVDLVVAPPFTSLAIVGEELNGSLVRVAAQNMHPRADGAFTGEVSGPMIRDAGATWVILGHSERRSLFHESNDDVAEKLVSAIEQGFVPIVCVGDSLEARACGRTLDALHAQLAAVTPILATTPGPATIAYEPVWAIGTGKRATHADAEMMHHAIRAHLAHTSPELSARARLIYGGPVGEDDAFSFLDQDDVDGFLLGMPGADVSTFAALALLADRAARGSDSSLSLEARAAL